MSSLTHMKVAIHLLPTFLPLIEPLARLETLICDHETGSADVWLTLRSGGEAPRNSMAIFHVENNKLTVSIEPVGSPQNQKESA